MFRVVDRQIVVYKRVRPGGSGYVLKQFRRNRIDAAGGNDVPWEGLPCNGIHQLPGDAGEITLTLRIGQDGSGISQRYIAQERALVSTEEKEAVLLDRAAGAASELIALEEVMCWREEVAGIQVAVAQKLEGAAVQLVGAGFGDHVDNRAGAAAVLGAVAVGLNAELLHRIRIWEGIVHIGVVVLVAAAVQIVIDVVGAGAVGTDGLPP